MAWTTIPNGDVDPESPITTSLMTALRDNVAAAMNGDTGAPLLVTNAMTKPAAGSVILFPVLSGTFIQGLGTAYVGAVYGQASNNAANIHCCTVLVPGVITVTLNQIMTVASGTNYLRVMKNGASVQEWTMTAATTTARSVDVTVSSGDVIHIQHMNTVNAAYARVSEIFIKSDSVNIAVA